MMQMFAARQGMPETALKELADAALQRQYGTPTLFQHSAEELIGIFREFRGKLRDTTIEDIVADRHRGLR
ncbi:hypothetical protein [Aeoliella sp.]|uniref:hypothetical protein n=1 Tax=Aeoliella sp. TaxID=2795800 RepID=UPI003CCC3CA2